MTAIFLAFQSQAWHTNDSGDLIDGATGCEAPLYDFSKGHGALICRRRGRRIDLAPIARRTARPRSSSPT